MVIVMSHRNSTVSLSNLRLGDHHAKATAIPDGKHWVYSRHDCHLLAIRREWPPRIQLLHWAPFCHMWSSRADCNWQVQPHRRGWHRDPPWRSRGPLQPDCDGAPNEGHLVANQPGHDSDLGVHDVENEDGVVWDSLSDGQERPELSCHQHVHSST
jgi:hypothetical protein